MKTLADEKMLAALDEVMRGITRRVTGLTLVLATGGAVSLEMCSVSLVSRGEAELDLFLDRRAMRAMTTFMNRGKELSDADAVDYIEEYFNILCGHVAGQFRRMLHKSVCFGTPVFSQNRGGGRKDIGEPTVYELRYGSYYGPVRLRAVLHEKPCPAGIPKENPAEKKSYPTVKGVGCNGKNSVGCR